MSLRTRLVLSLAVLLAGALLLAGVLVVQLTRASLVERVDRELLTIAGASTRIQRLTELADADSEAGRRLAVMQLSRTGSILRAFPSGFASEPDPLPSLPVYPGASHPGPTASSSSGRRSTGRWTTGSSPSRGGAPTRSSPSPCP